jgi:putative N-acetylmannosamine-6-phosphate epimerase
LVLHNNVPVEVVDNVDVPSQLLTIVTIGADGVFLGAAATEPGKLVQPFTVCATVYVFAVDTTIEGVVSFVLHNKLPVAAVDNVDVPQLLTNVTVGADGAVFGAADPEPGRLVQPFTVCVTV